MPMEKAVSGVVGADVLCNDCFSSGAQWRTAMLWTNTSGTAGSKNRDADSKAVRWRLVLTVGAAVAVLTYLLQQLIIYLYVFGPGFVESSVLGFLFPSRAPLQARQAESFGNLVGVYLMPALHLLLVAGAALWAGRRIGSGALLHGLLIGLVAALANQAIGLAYGPPIAGELVVYPLLGVAGGLAGGLWGWNVRSGEQALHRTSRAVGEARTSQEIAAAVGENLAGSNVSSVSVWTAPRKDEAEYHELAGSWSRTADSWPTSLSPDAAHLPELWRKPMILESEGLSGSERPAWQSWGVRKALLVPLVSACGESVGLLMVTSRKRRRFSRADRRAYSTAATGAALALQNLRLLEEARQSAILRERQRMAREIHDTLAQGFTSIVMSVEAAEGALARNPQAVSEYHAQIGRVARESLAEARRLVWALKPERLEDAASLPEALGTLTEAWSSESGIPCGIEWVGTPQALSEEVEATLLRCAQEALANVHKHAAASRAALTLSYMGEGMILDVRDDGEGFDPAAMTYPSGDAASGSSGGFGLRAMRERVERAGGTLTVESAPGEGTSLAIELPLKADTPNGHGIPEAAEEGR